MNESLQPPRQIRKFNPGTFQSDEEVIDQFVVRSRELGIVLDVLRGNIESSSCQHILIVAPRGRGKTMLLARIAAELRTHDELSERLLPVRFMEESQEIFNVGDFWLESLFYLAREQAIRDPDLSQELRAVHGALTAEWHGRELEERARAAVLETADRLDRQLVLMVENLQTLCRDVDDDFGWKLRKVLQSEPRIILLATATSRFKELDDTQHAFFELFRIVRLDPLDTGECRRLWQMVSGDVVSERGIRPLQILTGGSPRLLIIIGEFAQHRSLGQLMEKLVKLVDDHTEYFRGHLEGFAKAERRVYLATIDLWQPSTTGEIAARARMDVRAVSALLGRLVERGAVILEGSGRKRMYTAAERLYSIYYKLRRERDEAAVVRNLIHFTAVFYADDQLAEISETLRLEAAESPLIREGLSWAVAEDPNIGRSFPFMEHPNIERESTPDTAIVNGAVKQLLKAVANALEQEEFKTAVEIIDEFFSGAGTGSHPIPDSLIAALLFTKGIAHSELEDFEAEIATYDDVIQRFGERDEMDIQATVIRVLLNKGHRQRQLGETDAAIATYDDMIARFGDSDTSEFQVIVARVMVEKGILRRQLGDPTTAIAVFKKVVDSFGNNDQPDVQEQAAKALVNIGDLRTQLGEGKTAIASFDEVDERFGRIGAPMVQEGVATALLLKARTLATMGESRAVIVTCDEMIERFGRGDVPEVQASVAAALLCKVLMRCQLGEFEEAIATCDEAIKRFGESEHPELRFSVGMTLINKAIALAQIGETEAAIATCNEVVERLGNSDAPEFRRVVAKALLNRGFAQGQLGQTEAAVATWDEVVERFGDSDARGLQLEIAMALNNKGIGQRRLGDIQGAIASFDGLISGLGSNVAGEIQVQVAWALGHKAETQIEMGLAEQGLHTCDDLEQRVRVLTAPGKLVFERCARWLRIKALLVQEKHSAAMDTFRSLYAAFVPENDVMMREMLTGIPDLIAAGVSERDMVEILSGDDEKANALAPLVVALRQRTGEAVRTPAEVREVAADIDAMIEARAGRYKAVPLGAPSI